MRVENAHGAPPSVPFWNGEAPGRTKELSEEVSSLREELEPMLDDEARAVRWLVAECAVPEAGAAQMVRYLGAARDALGALPTQKTIVAERFFDEAGGMQLVMHAPFGAQAEPRLRAGAAQALLPHLRFRAAGGRDRRRRRCSRWARRTAFRWRRVFDFLAPGTIDEMLTQAALARAHVGGALALERHPLAGRAAVARRGGRSPSTSCACAPTTCSRRSFPPQAQCQENATGAIEPPDHPLVRETLRDCLTEAMDIEALRALLLRMQRGELRLIARDTPEPSPLSHEILNSAPYAYLDDAPLEERRSRAVQMRRSLDPRDAAGAGRAGRRRHRGGGVAGLPRRALGGRAARRAAHAGAASAEVPPAWAAVPGRAARRGAGRPARRVLARDRARRRRSFWTRCAAGWASAGPVTAAELAEKLGVASVEAELAALENDGLVLRGRYRAGAVETEWCERTLLARIHSLTLGRLRREIEPATTQDFHRFLFRWQHLHPGTQLHGAQGLSEVTGAAAGLPGSGGRVGERHPPFAGGAVRQGAARPALLLGEIAGAGSPAPTSRRGARRLDGQLPSRWCAARILEWMLDATRGAPEPLGERARLLLALLEQRGALFLHELRAQTGLERRDLNGALWELVSGGRVTCDGFAALRGLLDGKPHGASGRWSLLRPLQNEPPQPFLEKLAGQYLRRYGVVFRDLLVARAALPALARAPPGLPAHGGARRDPRRPLRPGLLRRAVRALRGGGRPPGGPQAPQGRRGAHLFERLRPAQFHRDC